MRYAYVLVALVAFAVVPAWAEELPPLGEIRLQQAELRQAARAGNGIFEELPEPKRMELLAKQDAVLALIEGKHSADQLDAPVRTEVFQRLEEIKALVQQAEDRRVVCEYAKPIGSHMKSRVCLTVAERRERREKARFEMERRPVCGNCVSD